MNPDLRTVLKAGAEGTLLNVFVQPRASRNEIIGLQGDELKVRLTSPPVEGAANKLCREFFAKLLRLPKGDVELVSGDKSRHKRLLFRGLSAEVLERALLPHLGG